MIKTFASGGVAFLLCLAAPVGRADAATPNADSDKYAFLAGSQWYVPQSTLPAIDMDLATGAVMPVLDQTVWDIAGYQDGYFWGRTVASFARRGQGPAGAQIACSRMLGSVTPDGQVYITFVSDTQKSAVGAVRGIGTLALKGQGGQFTMQMSTGTTSITAHWSYMNQCKMGQPCESKLPGSKLSLAQFLAQCD